MKVSIKQDKNSNSGIHGFWAVVLLAGLFAGGLLIGLTWNYSKTKSADAKQIAMSADQCDSIARRITNETNAEKLRSLNEIYSANCAGREFIEPAPQPIVTDNLQNLTTCEKIEKLLFEQLHASTSQDRWHHEENARTYQKLAQYGCPDNQDTFKQMVSQEYAIANALGGSNSMMAANMRTCEEIEAQLLPRIEQNPYDCDAYLHNAEIYSTMAERGCPENAEKYKSLALRQIEVATAISEDAEMAKPKNKEIVIDTYKKLQMQQQARDFLNKMQKLVDPATEFIYQVGKVIDE